MKSLFGEVNNLAGFVHPKFNKEFKFMNERQSVNLARKILEEFIKTNIKNATDIMYYECEEETLRKYLGHCYFSKPKPKEVILNVLKRIP